MNQSKNNNVDARSDKRERRRVPSGRAAVLRRAPSDSDCSGETASLSADSGDRAIRPVLPPPRAAKSRRLHISVNSRRRGSEWEVLEGLKDGQRFEKRPDVFNGYLHKKRKWPLKGWHKRFFVVDGGILVYARSPADVARGRLHGSVDVGLSVISAKARRRRIDIDADEFIYHLRAKTPELFRTWLNVLKAHRLYRQHLLTFGVRESAPKIHAPSDDQPATDTSSHTSFTSETSLSNTTVTSNDHQNTLSSPPDKDSSVYCHKADNSICNWQRECISKCDLVPLNYETEEMFDLKFDEAIYKNHSLCSMNCIARKFKSLKKKLSPGLSMNSTDAEQQMICTDLDLNSLKSNDLQSSLLDKLSLISEKNIVLQKMARDINDVDINKKQSFFVNKVPTTTACYFFTRKKRHISNNESVMRNSKKCTNLVKYKNMSDEPPLKTPTSKCMLLGKYKLKASKHSGTISPQNKAIGCETLPKESEETQDEVERENKASQNVMTSTDYDRITEKLMISIFQKQTDGDDSSELKYYIDRVVKDLYDVKVDQDAHPVKALFRCLLEYWLKNTSVSQFKEAMTSAKSIERQSNKYFTRDENLSSVFVHMLSKETQMNRIIDSIGENKTANTKQVKNKRELHEPVRDRKSPRRDTESFEKEKRIQELERLLKNTVYICETQRNNKCREKDIKITKKLIDNLEKISKKPDDIEEKQNIKVLDKSVSSTELPEIQDTINNLITETAIPPDFAKEFLGAYLDVLLHDESKSTITSQSSDWSAQSRDIPACEVQAESIIKKVSRSITTEVAEKSLADHKKPVDNEKQIDPGQVYLKDVLDKITTIFTKVKNSENRNWEQNKLTPKQVNDYVPNATKDELGRPVKICSMKNFIYENCDEKSLVIDLSKYNLEHIAMFNDPAIKGIMSITIKLREKPSNSGESKQTHLNLKFADEVKPIITPLNKSDNLMSLINDNSGSRDIFNKIPKSMNQPYIFESNKELIDIKPYLSVSDATSKAYRFQNDSDHSIPSLKSDSMKDITADIKATEDPQSCYIMSFKKNTLATKFQCKKKVKLKHDDGINSKDESPSTSPTRIRPEELTVFEKPTPRIIDEKFILLLLENLMQLSKNVPTLFKDINCLYIKLRKKHDKVLKNCSNIQGLSLLGKIYNDESYVNGFNDKTTQIDSDLEVEVEKDKTDNKNCGTNTILNVSDKEIDTISLEKEMIVHEIPERENKAKPKLKLSTLFNVSLVPNDSNETKASSSNKERMIVTQTETMDIDSIDHATSIPNWFSKLTKDTAISTIIKYVFDNDGSQNFKMTAARPIKIEREQLKKKRHSPKMRQDLIKEITLLSPSFKVSTQSQTENQVLFIRTEKKKERDFNVYQLFLSQHFGLKGSSSMTVANVNVNNSDDMNTVYRCSSDPSYVSGLISPTSPTLRGPQAGFVSGTPGGRLAGWIIESGGPLENATRELGQAQLSVQQLQRLLDALELQQQVHHDTDVSLDGASPNVKKDRRKFGLRKKKSSNKCASVELAPPHIDPSSSHTALSTLTAPPSPGGGASSIPNLTASLPIACAAARPQSLPGAESMVTIQAGPASLTSLTPDHQLREDFTVLAKDLVASLKGVVSTLVCERSRLRAAMEAADTTAIPGNASMATLRTNLTSALQQNSELRSRLSRIHDASDIAEITDPSQRAFQQSLSYSSSCVSASEFFDAEEHEDDDDDDLKPEVIAADEAGVIELDGDSSSEAGSLSSEEGSASSDNSEGAMLSAEAVTLRHDADAAVSWTRRTRLPTPRPAPGGPSLWNLLYKNIGKDLSQISMPVTINEPLNMLQRLCEELEYSELLDAAAESGSGVERLALVAAFAVSAYAASAHRAASKPFNPLLAETYECVRDDRGFRFLAEQVSHHPPISACHAESPRWCFWQEARIKTKFWGKSMEFQPTGRVHVRLNTTGDHYTWNKVTTCVHNLFGGQRWVDQYGDMHITCVGTDLSCKLNFIKASSWSQSRHEVRGGVTGGRGVRLRLAGRWSEALHAGEPPAARCLWRPGAMPPDHELYYGFTRFAMELNELEPGMKEALPPTDTRLRPDQRALEEGLVDAAEQLKHELEQSQRERRRDSTQHTPAWFRKVTEEGEETWVFSGEYWKAREAGFNNDALPRIW